MLAGIGGGNGGLVLEVVAGVGSGVAVAVALIVANN